MEEEKREDISEEIQKTVQEETPVITKEIAEKEEKIAEAVAEIPPTKDELEIRKDKVIKYLKKSEVWVIGILIIALILGVQIRSLPLQDHGGNPGLWDITTNSWSLGPDLDPWLFERYAETIVEEGALPSIDLMRNVPLGFDTSKESQLLPYMIASTYWMFNSFSFGVEDVTVKFAAAIFPVIMFALTIIAFFLFVREIFIRKNEKSKLKANLISLVSTFFMIVIPVFLSRTIAGIPEKESAGFFFMFITFYFFLKSWKSENLNKSIIFSVLSGIATGLMGLIWGGVIYLFVAIGLSNLIAFILNKIKKKELINYSLWLITSLFILITFSNKYTLGGFLKSTSNLVVVLTFFVLVVHLIFSSTNMFENKLLRKTKLPKNIKSLIIAIIAGITLISLIFGPSFIVDKIQSFIQTFINPVVGRLNVTVAENRQPFFIEWASNFGPFVKKIPLTFWMFFIGSVVLFKKMLKDIKNKDAWVLTGVYVIFLLGLIFSRYSSSSTFNGENFISKLFYFGSALLFLVYLLHYYLKYDKEGHKGFEKIRYEYLLAMVLIVLTLFTARSAVRLVMVLGPVSAIFIGYLIVEGFFRFYNEKDQTKKIIIGGILILILLSSTFTFWTFYKGVKAQAYNFVPSSYNQQWQKAMSWVRDNTSSEAVFSHWWDYGYWIQSIGERATVLDGGNAISYWNYLMGRWVLTGETQKDALEFLYNHNANYLLIDSTDIGKYTAFSSIGSDQNYDRRSWIGTFLLDETQTRETQNQTILFYTGGIAIDEDLIIERNGRQILLPKEIAGVGAIAIPVQNIDNETVFSQPYIITIYQGTQQNIHLRYMSVAGEFIDFGTGIEAAVYVFPRLNQNGQRVGASQLGAAMYISPRLMRGMLSQVYILGDPLNNFPNFKLAHSEPNLFIQSLNNQGMNLPEFVYFRGIQGPIKIWKITYTGEEQMREEYVDTDYRKYIDWKA